MFTNAPILSEAVNYLKFLKIEDEYEATNELIEDEIFIKAFIKGREQIDKREYEAWEDVSDEV